MTKLKSGKAKIDVGEFKKELYAQFGKGARLQGKFYDELENIAREAAQDLIDEFNNRSSMRESQASGDSYFRSGTHTNIHNKPFSGASVVMDDVSKGVVSVTVAAPVTSTKGVTADVFKIIDEGRSQKQTSKKIVYPMTDGTLVKKNLQTVKRVNRIFNNGGVRYKRDKKGRIKMYVGNTLSKVEGRDILGVLAREIEARIANYRVRFIKGQPAIGRGMVKVKVKR